MKIKYALVMAVSFQVFVLVGMVAKAALPLWTGEEIRLNTLPVDPRSLFRGNYARLGYDISSIPQNALPEHATLRHGEPVFVSLQPGPNGTHQFHSASLKKPKDGLYLRGRLQLPYGPVNGQLPVRYGIEAWFAPKEKALALEHQLRDGALAVLKVSSNGAARLQAIEEKPAPTAQRNQGVSKTSGPEP